MSKISDKTDKFLLNYSYSFWGPLFIGTRCSMAEWRQYHSRVWHQMPIVWVNGDRTIVGSDVRCL